MDYLPRDVFVHDSVEAVVEVTAWKMKGQQWLEQVWPAQLWGEVNVARLTVESDDGLDVRHHITPLFL